MMRPSTRMPRLPTLLAAAAVAAAVLAPRSAAAQRDAEPTVSLRLQGEASAGLPFVLAAVAEGFDESPAPAQPTLTIPGATVTAMGAQPSVQQSIQIVNGRRYESHEVTWVFRYRVVADKPGTFQVPALTVTQGGKRATAQPARLPVREVPQTTDMKIVLDLPARPVWVGETIEAHLDWLLRRDPDDQSFNVPLLAMEDKIAVTVPPATDRRQALTFSAGARDVEIPFSRDQVVVDGVTYARLRFALLIAPRQAGRLEVPAATAVARLAVGPQDFFGRAESRLFRASDAPHALDVKPLPVAGRPPSFAGAVGASFSIATRSSRSVVQLGEPVDLDVTIKSDSRLDTLSLGKLDGEGGLSPTTFEVPADPPVGELSEDGKTKTFRVSVQVIGAATEIPALPFSYFDPVKAQYQTIHSEPIALSVKGGGVVVGAADVAATAPRKTASAPAAAAAASDLSLVGADLALSAPGETLDTSLSGGALWAVVIALYALPLLLFGARTWQVRTAGRREEAGEVKAARQRVAAELARAATVPAKEAATALPAALRQLARALGVSPADDGGLLARIETEGFAPGSAPLAEALRRDAEALAKGWSDEARRAPRGRAVTTAAIALAIVALPAAVKAAPLDDARAAYQQALGDSDAGRRRADFARASGGFAAAAAQHPDSPALLTDWGNAALGAGDVGAATLAYRRALAAHGGDQRARKNLAWLRARQPDNLRPHTGGAAEALFFFHEWTRPRRLLVGAAAFALAVLLCAPWSPRRRRLWTGLAVAPAVVWIAMTASVLVEEDRSADAVIVESAVLRAADSPGAPPALTQPLPPGAEVAVLERRGGWSRVALAGGTTGWLADGALEPVTAAPR